MSKNAGQRGVMMNLQLEGGVEGHCCGVVVLEGRVWVMSC